MKEDKDAQSTSMFVFFFYNLLINLYTSVIYLFSSETLKIRISRYFLSTLKTFYIVKLYKLQINEIRKIRA